VVVLQDPLGISDQPVALPHSIAPLLELCDGTRDLPTLRCALELRTGLRIGPDYLENVLAQLDQAFLLENERFAQGHRDALERFRASPSRPPCLAGNVYPADPDWLQRTFDQYFELDSSPEELSPTNDLVRGLVSPHIDYQRGAPVYAGVWRRAAAAVRSVEVAVILGTNHFDCRRLFTLTRQNYSTPWGVLPTAMDVVDKVASALGEEEALAEELHHRSEHSIEIAAVWLHYLVRDKACKLVPVLCGSFQRFIEGNQLPREDKQIAQFVDAVKEATAGRRTLIVAAADLAHIGPAFGDHHPIDLARKANHSAADSELISAVTRGDADRVFAIVKAERDQRRICGLSPIYLTLRILGKTKGETTGYLQCPADQRNTSFVSICGIILG
jgi:AmmeMemoRadiSam system protein B